MTTSNVYGRQVIEALTNKSGGSVAAGDVVIIDTTNDTAFTTTTTSGFTGLIGIAQETIANNATGRVLTAGFASLVNVSASVTRGNYGKTFTVAKQATDAGSSRGSGVFCEFLTGGTTPSAHVFGLADASTSSSGVPAGTSFPGSPATNDLFFRTDNGMLFQYDGTRWLSSAPFELVLPIADVLDGGTVNFEIFTTLPADFAVYLVKGTVSGLVLTTNNGSNFWSFQFKTKVLNNTATNRGSAVDTSAGANNTWIRQSVTLGIALTTNDLMMLCSSTKTGSPGGLYMTAVVTCRFIGT